MKHASSLCFVLSPLFCTRISSLKVPKTLVKPQLLMEPTPPEAIWLYDIAHTAPHLLLQSNQSRRVLQPQQSGLPAHGQRADAVAVITPSFCWVT